jgi:NADH-quinone oxidoreductase subunit H
VVLAALAIVLLFAAPTPRALAAALDGLVARARARVGDVRGERSSPRSRLLAALSAATWTAVPPAGAPALVDAAAAALLALLPFGQYLVASQLDVGILYVGAATALATGALLAAPGPLRGVKAALHVVWQHVPGAVAVACVVVGTGSLRIQEILRAQGGAPWEWHALRSPAALAALVVLLACMLVEPAEPPRSRGIASLIDAPAQRAPEPAGDSMRPRRPWLEAACRGHRAIMAGLASALLLGGWSLPGVAPAVQGARPLLELAGAVVLLAKTAALLVGCAWTRWLLPPRTLGDRSRAVLVKLLPLSLLALAGAAVWVWVRSRGATDPTAAFSTEGAESLWSGGVSAGIALLSLALLSRTLHAFPGPRATSSSGGPVPPGASPSPPPSERQHVSAFF